MTETQEYLLKLLKEFDELCQRHDIDYYLAGGSLIGALRHEGFLPWDDDADVHISAKNAERVIKAIEEEGLKDRHVMIRTESGDYMNVHWRYENTASTLLMRGLTGSTGDQGQFIDMFLYYPLPNDEKEQEEVVKKFDIYKELKSQNANINSQRSREYLEEFYKYKKREKKEGKKEVIRALEEEMFNYPEEGATHTFLVCPVPPKHIVPVEMWGKPRRVKFEDTYLPVPEQAERYLAYHYGPSWFEVPSHTERESHIFVKDFDIPFKVYTNEYDKHIDVKGFYDSEVRKKDFWFEIMHERNVVNPRIRKMQGLRTVLEIQNKAKLYNLNPKEMLERGETMQLEVLFAPYFKQISTDDYKYWGLYLDMPDDYLYAALYPFCFNGKYQVARKVLSGRRNEVNRELTPELSRLCKICDNIDDLLYTMYGDCNEEKAEELTYKYYEEEPEVLYFMRQKLFFDLKKADGKDADQLMKECDEFLSKWPRDGELLKYKGDIYGLKGDVEKSEKCYRKAFYNVANGYCMTWIKNYFIEKYGEFKY